MGKQSAIEWTDATWNPWMGCSKVSAGCKNCYMFRDQKRFGHDPTELRRSKTTFRDPLKWKEPRMVFVCSWSDFFWEEVPDEWRKEAWAVMAMSSRHTFLLLTKRPENIRAMLPNNWTADAYPNVWLGASAENQAMANLRIPELLEIPAQVHFVSAEPLLGPINFRRWFHPKLLLNWIITGGESGFSNPRTMYLDWAINIRNQCRDSGVPFFHKQHGGSRKIDGAWGGREINGRTWDEIPTCEKVEDFR